MSDRQLPVMSTPQPFDPQAVQVLPLLLTLNGVIEKMRQPPSPVLEPVTSFGQGMKIASASSSYSCQFQPRRRIIVNHKACPRSTVQAAVKDVEAQVGLLGVGT
jgi:hypothetical protein